MHPSENLTGVRSPMAQQSSFEMLFLEGLLEKGVFTEIQHAKAEIQAG
jgi:hypothetical protein